MVDEIKKKYQKVSGLDKEEDLPGVEEIINYLFNAERASVDAGIEAAKQEYENKIKKLNNQKKQIYSKYEKPAAELLGLSRFRIGDIAPILADIISLYEGENYEYKTDVIVKNCIPSYYLSGIQMSTESIKNLGYSEMLLDKRSNAYSADIQFLGCTISEYDCSLEMNKHQIFERCPYLLEFIEMLIKNEVAKLPKDEQLPAIKKVESEFIHNNLDIIKRRHEEINEQEQINYQTKLLENQKNRENMLSKTLEKLL